MLVRPHSNPDGVSLYAVNEHEPGVKLELKSYFESQPFLMVCHLIYNEIVFSPAGDDNSLLPVPGTVLCHDMGVGADVLGEARQLQDKVYKINFLSLVETAVAAR